MCGMRCARVVLRHISATLTVNQDKTKALRLTIVDDDRTLPDFVDLPDVDVFRVLIPSDKIWVDSSLVLLPFQIDSAARSVLIRYPSAVRCKNFAQELHILEDERQEDPVPLKWNYFNLRAEFPRPYLGYQFTVVAYGEVRSLPCRLSEEAHSLFISSARRTPHHFLRHAAKRTWPPMEAVSTHSPICL